MTLAKELRFSAHARLKDIVGSGLIMSDGIAIIELIKNSKDAGSPSVRIEFREADINKGETELIISDHGEGMSVDDIEHKWLNIAYSEKKYGNPIHGAYAGSKGIGRFSCDRLGSELTIFTKKLGEPFVKLDIDWTDFEVDDRDTDIGKISIFVDEFSDEEFSRETGESAFESGTVLAIRRLRRHWDRWRLNSLRSELERFIVDPNNEFFVEFSHWKFSDDDEINAPIKNKIFEELDFKTTSIQAKTINEGTQIHFELRHDGDFVFKSTEINPYFYLKNVYLNLFFLNQPAKAFFKRQTGYRSIDYGSVFLFLNGFRVSPYGSIGDDWLGIQRRQAQGTKRFFSTRDLVGFIQVSDAEGISFTPVSSREGIVRNLAFQQLASSEDVVENNIDDKKLFGFFHKAMRKLEKFVVEGLDWDRIDRETGDVKEEDLLSGNYKYLASEKPILETLDSIIRIRSPEDYIEDIDINVKYLSQLARKETQKYEELIEALEEKFEGTSIDELKPAERRDLSKFISRQAKELAQKDQTNIELEKKAQKELQARKVEEKRRIFVELEVTADKTRILQLHHQVALVAGELHERMYRVVRKYRENVELFTKDELLKLIESCIFGVQKIQNVAKLATKANFDISTNLVRDDLVQFVEEYLDNFKDLSYGWGIQVEFSNEDGLTLEISFRPAEITMLIDNLIDNAGKAGANLFVVNIASENGIIVMQFDDDGEGLTDRFTPAQLFEKGVTTTSGSGIGLWHAKQIVEELGGNIKISNIASGSRVKMEFKI